MLLCDHNILFVGFLCRDVPSSAALPIIRPALGRQQSIAERAKRAMQGYLNHFLGNISIVNSPEVCFVHELLKIYVCHVMEHSRYSLSFCVRHLLQFDVIGRVIC